MINFMWRALPFVIAIWNLLFFPALLHVVAALVLITLGIFALTEKDAR